LSRGFICSVIEVAVNVEDGAHRSVTKTVRDDLGVLTLSDEERYLGTSQGMGAKFNVEVG
jgi:hypothetical protein